MQWKTETGRGGDGKEQLMADLIHTDPVVRSIPHSLEAEQSVLGAILLDPEQIKEIADSIHADDFYLEQHQKIFEAMQELFLQSRTIDVVTLLDVLVKQGTYSEAGGKSYITLLAQTVPSIANLKDYLKIIRERATLRRLIQAAEQISDMAYTSDNDVDAILDRSEQLIFSIAQGQVTKGFVHIKDALMMNFNHLERLMADRESEMGTPTYFSELDKLLVGMGDSDLVLVGARPGMGKTSFALNIATNVAFRRKKAVAVFSLEMSTEQLVGRMLSSEACVDSYKLRSGELDEDEWIKLSKAAGVLCETDILIDDTTGITVTGMKAKLRRVKNLGLVIIDYLQLMQSDRRIDNRVQEVAEISRGLKLLAKDLKVPVITCAQLSRGPESRTDKKPMLSDLRDSGAIEQDADIVLFLYRDDYYKDDPEGQNTAEVIVAKNRHGSTGKAVLGWYGQYTKFTTIDTAHEI